MVSLHNRKLKYNSHTFSNCLIQGPLAGFSCAPFRELFYNYEAPAYTVSEMISAQDVLKKHALTSRYLYRSPKEQTLCYQLAGTDPVVMAQAASKLESLGADIIDINCGCPKTKIRKKGAGSALLENPEKLLAIVAAIRQAIQIPLTVKIRLQTAEKDIQLAQSIAEAGADALIVHGRRWTDNYDQACDYQRIAQIKQAVSIPIIANGDISNEATLALAMQSGCDAYMISRAGTGKPWLYQQLLNNRKPSIDYNLLSDLFMTHLHNLALLESDHKALLQSKSLVRYYFPKSLNENQLQTFYSLQSLQETETYIRNIPSQTSCALLCNLAITV